MMMETGQRTPGEAVKGFSAVFATVSLYVWIASPADHFFTVQWGQHNSDWLELMTEAVSICRLSFSQAMRSCFVLTGRDERVLLSCIRSCFFTVTSARRLSYTVVYTVCGFSANVDLEHSQIYSSKKTISTIHKKALISIQVCRMGGSPQCGDRCIILLYPRQYFFAHWLVRVFARLPRWW